MRTGKNVIWIAAFVILLIINVAVIATAMRSSRPPGDSSQEMATFLIAKDEVQLTWWPDVVSPEGSAASLKPIPVRRVFGNAEPVGLKLGEGEVKEYPELMDDYFKGLRRYLTKYFNVTTHRMEGAEE